MGNEEKHGQNDENRWKTMKNDEKRSKKRMKNPWRTMKTKGQDEKGGKSVQN